MPFGPWPGVSSGGGGGTLASIYTFGLANPSVDNIFPNVHSTMIWPLDYLNLSTGEVGVGYFDTDNTLTGNLQPENYVRLLGRFPGIFNLGRRFNQYSLNDSTWNGSPSSVLSSPQWQIEAITVGNAPETQFNTLLDQLFAERDWQYTSVGWIYPNPPGVTLGMCTTLGMYDNRFGFADIFRWSSSGQQINLVQANAHGITPAFVISWVPSGIATDQLGDGSGYFFSLNQSINFDFQHARGAITFLTANDTGSFASDSFYTSLWAYATGNGDTITEVVQAWASIRTGLNIVTGGIQWPALSYVGYPVSDNTGESKVIWSTPNLRFMYSENATAYTPLVGARTSISYGYNAYQPLTIGYSAGAGIAFQFPYTTIAGVAPNPSGIQTEIAPGYKVEFVRITAFIAANSLSASGGGSASTSFEITQNGTGIGIFAGGVGGVPNATTGYFDSGEIDLHASAITTALTDSWGMLAGGTSPTGGSITGFVTVSLY